MTTPYKILAFAALFLIVLGVGWCSLRKEQPTPVTPARSEAERVKAIDLDSIASIYEAEKIAAFNEGKTAGLKDFNSLKVAILQLEKKVQQSEQGYAKTPTLAKCDTLLKQQSGLIGVQRQAIAKCETVNAVNDSIITTFGKTVQRKDMVINLLNDNLKRSNEGWQQTSEELLKAKKPKRFSVGLQIGYGATEKGLTPYIGGGIGYSIVRF